MKRLLFQDKILGTTFIAILIVGFLFFLSASLGVLSVNSAKFVSIMKAQIVLGFIGGFIVLFLAYKVPLLTWQKISPYLFFLSLFICLLVFVPHIGFSHGGARRWISLFGFSFQPAELLKATSLLYLSALYSKWATVKIKKFDSTKSVLLMILPALMVIVLSAGVLIKQPDTKSLVLIIFIAVAILFIVGMPYKWIGIFFILAIVGLAVLISAKPYVASRFKTFINPESDPHGASYQLRQSLIGLGSGGTFGYGFGKSVQKFGFLPEPQGDSIFAVVGEETGLIGGLFVIGLYMVFILRGLKLSNDVISPFGRLFGVGFFSLFAFQSFLNIGSTVGVIPLTGVPLPFMSQGGSSVLIMFVLFGIFLKALSKEKLKKE